jgi:SAM-dependent methyltransferase
MGDYTNMSAYYDVIMTSGYYDYDAIAESILNHPKAQSILEIGCGTGLILEALAKRQSGIDMTGIDLTQAMLSIAHQRLHHFKHITLSQANVTTFNLHKTFELAFSYGGVWYFVIDGSNEPFMVSHLAHDQDNLSGLEHIARHLATGATLLLGIQGPHHDYAKPISNGMIYSQKISAWDHGFIKDYFLHDGTTKVMEQNLTYRTYTFEHAQNMMARFGLRYQHQTNHDGRFLAFTKI